MVKKIKKKAFLLILDGWGIGAGDETDAIAQANTPFVDALLGNELNSTLVTYGERVGLPNGQMGNSEVGHLNIGAGRIVYQDLTRIDRDIASGAFECRKELQDFIGKVNENSTIHLLGLLSDGGVHSHIDHLRALVEAIENNTMAKTSIHAFLDGRDTDPHGGKGYCTRLEDFLSRRRAKLASVIGRYYAMDRDNRWERTQKAYDLLVRGQGAFVDDVAAHLEESYHSEVTDEFMLPFKTADFVPISNGDAVIFFNFRSDRPRQLTYALSQADMPDFNMHRLSLDYLTFTEYDSAFANVNVLYPKDELKNTIGEYLDRLGFSQLRAAETEKYPHVTYFLNGGRETPFAGEKRLLVPSPKVATYDLQPEMSALELTEQAGVVIKEEAPDFICLNFANTDMVGHTGIFSAAVKAAETVDKCVSQLFRLAHPLGYDFIIIADHGNSDLMINPDGTPHTAHTKNPVPVIILTDGLASLRKDGCLADIAPTILDLMGLEKPIEMTGKSLVNDECIATN